MALDELRANVVAAVEVGAPWRQNMLLGSSPTGSLPYRPTSPLLTPHADPQAGPEGPQLSFGEEGEGGEEAGAGRSLGKGLEAGGLSAAGGGAGAPTRPTPVSDREWTGLRREGRVTDLTSNRCHRCYTCRRRPRQAPAG